MPANRSPKQARRAKSKPVKPLFRLDLGLELELDFDPDDFDHTDDEGRYTAMNRAQRRATNSRQAYPSRWFM